MPGIQLAHAVRKASHDQYWRGDAQLPPADGGWPTLGPSALPCLPTENAPQALNQAGIGQVIADFCTAINGYQVIKIHAAHGYLLHQFLSPLSNQRTDKYGGSFESCIRLLTQVVEAVRAELLNWGALAVTSFSTVAKYLSEFKNCP